MKRLVSFGGTGEGGGFMGGKDEIALVVTGGDQPASLSRDERRPVVGAARGGGDGFSRSSIDVAGGACQQRALPDGGETSGRTGRRMRRPR